MSRKIFFCGEEIMETKKEENIWRNKIYFFAEQKKNGERKIRFLLRRRKTEEEKEKNIWRRKIHLIVAEEKKTEKEKELTLIPIPAVR